MYKPPPVLPWEWEYFAAGQGLRDRAAAVGQFALLLRLSVDKLKRKKAKQNGERQIPAK